MNELFVDSESGNYDIKDIENLSESISDFQKIPLEKNGRVAE